MAYHEVTDEIGLGAYEDLIVAYWELAEESRPFVLGVNRWAHELGDRGARWVAFMDGIPVGKTYLSYLGTPGTAAIFGVYVEPEARGHSVATTLTGLAIDRAAERGFERVVLHSSEMGLNLYARMGFVERCAMPAYATTKLHSIQPA